MKLSVETDYGTVFDLLGKPGMLHSGQQLPAPDGIELTCEGVLERRAADASVFLDFGVQIASGVTATFAAKWLWEKIGSKSRKVSIERKEIELSPNGFVRIVEEKLEVEE